MVSGFGQFHTDEPGAKQRKPYTGITWPEVTAMVDNPQQVPKGKAQWLIPSVLPSRCFLRQEAEGEYWMLWADLDKAPPPQQQVTDALTMEIVGGADFEVFSSRSATAEKPKARILIPLGQPLRGADWVLCQEVLNDQLEAQGIQPDRVSERTGQLCYLPNRGDHYEAASQRSGTRFDPLQAWASEIAAKRQALADKAAALEAARKAAAEARAARAARPGGVGGRSVIDAFNGAYHVTEILRQAGYKQRGDTFCHPASESGSYSASVKDGRVHSLSSSDPLYTEGGGVGAHDAFSAFEVLMHGGNRDAALKDAGARWLTIGGESWNTVERREWAQRQQQQEHAEISTTEGGAAKNRRVESDTTKSEPDDDTPPPLFAVVPFATLAHTEPEPPAYWWHGYLPAGVVTLLGAHGGAGKSTLALMLAVCIALGLPLFGIATKRGRVAFFSGEDGATLVLFRLALICRCLGVNVADLAGWLHVIDATSGEPTLFHEVSHKGARMGMTTPSYSALREYVEVNQIDVLMVDNASDAYDASEIDRARVRAFMRSLARIAQERAGAVLLLVHVDKGTSRGERTGTESYSGSTAWHNSARSRLYLARDKDGAGLRLEHQKLNVGKAREPLALQWPENGIPQLEPAFGPVVQAVKDRGDTAALLRLLHEFYLRGEFIAVSTSSPKNAARVLSLEKSYPRIKATEAFQLLREADRKGLIERQSYRDANRKAHERWALTYAGCSLIGAPAPTAPTAPTYEDGALSAGGAGGAPTAPTCGAGGVGGWRAHTKAGADGAAT